LTDGYLRVARVLHGTTAEGPGLRTAVWFEGCSIQCKGCINPQLFNSRGGTGTPIAEIVDQAVAAGVEGLTLIGGEPFDQPASGAALASAAQGRGLGVIAFSGYEYESLLGRDDVTKAFLAATDLLVDGPYQARNPETHRALVGSSNQRFIHLTERYKAYKPEVLTNRIDVRVRPDGSIDVAGFLDADGLKDLLQTTETSRAFRGRQA
jgi:anaerobic ribonucleoside-triphosphate reductase activating protein